MRDKILLVGIISNVAKTIEKEVDTVVKALDSFRKIQMFLVESDSSDNTIQILNIVSQKYENFSFTTMGQLSNIYPNRIARIAYCRNIYVDFIRQNFQRSKWQYVAVADLDGMNKNLKRMAVDSCFETEIKWDGIMANQKNGYYDIYALRAKNWVETDCFYELENLKKSSPQPKIFKNRLINLFFNFNHFDNLRNQAIFSKMKVISKTTKPIKVESAFGGFAIYKTAVFLKSDYNSSNYKESEHVEFHKKLTKLGFNFFINPKLINNNFNSYNISKFKTIRFIRELRKAWQKSRVYYL